MRRTDAIIEALAGRRDAGSASRSSTVPEPGAVPPGASGVSGVSEIGRLKAGDAEAASQEGEEADPAVRLLRALVADVDEQASERAADPSGDALPGTLSPGPGPGPGSGSRRRGPRTIVALGVVGAVLASTGVAAAGGGLIHGSASPPSAAGAGKAQKTAPEGEATAAAVRERLPEQSSAPSAQSAPSGPAGPSTPVRRRAEPAKEPGTRPGHEEIERLKRRLERRLPPESRPRVPGGQSRHGVSPKSAGPGDDDVRRRLEELRKRAQNRPGKYRHP
ncbi:hypothetical protein [Actinomadura xylanilytica]|uniref:hypothetical protein n=1 Tax=Actinomadura xylanilytica TaxID=887459 RepID=UPI00255AEB12|nr:hypothetical protein [Actinomadura xylanilytica]MDL4776218.1 hypothetical protein [Actinomadura xylanilytica]